MENVNPLEIPVKGSTLEKAIINVVNKMVRDMYNEDGTIKFMEREIETNKETAKKDVEIEETERKENVNELADMIISLTEE